MQKPKSIKYAGVIKHCHRLYKCIKAGTNTYCGTWHSPYTLLKASKLPKLCCVLALHKKSTHLHDFVSGLS